MLMPDHVYAAGYFAGLHRLVEQGEQAIVQGGMSTVIDYEHASRYATFANDPQKAGRAAGRCKLECKNGELWATAVKS